MIIITTCIPFFEVVVVVWAKHLELRWKIYIFHTNGESDNMLEYVCIKNICVVSEHILVRRRQRRFFLFFFCLRVRARALPCAQKWKIRGAHKLVHVWERVNLYVVILSLCATQRKNNQFYEKSRAGGIQKKHFMFPLRKIPIQLAKKQPCYETYSYNIMVKQKLKKFSNRSRLLRGTSNIRRCERLEKCL